MADRSSDDGLDFMALAQVATIETDRYCEGCGYNLRTQAVCRDPRTQILLCRCPECGRYHPAAGASSAAHPWLGRLLTLATGIWVVLLVSILVGWGFCLFGLNITTIEELARAMDRAGAQTPAERPSAILSSSEYWDVVGGMGLLSLGVALVGGVGVAILFPQWRRRAADAVVIAWPLLAGMVVWAVVLDAGRRQPPQPIWWTGPYVLGQILVQAVGGLIGAGIGRPLARLAVRVLLPSRLRPFLGYLWRADGSADPGRPTRVSSALRGRHLARLLVRIPSRCCAYPPRMIRLIANDWLLYLRGMRPARLRSRF